MERLMAVQNELTNREQGQQPEPHQAAYDPYNVYDIPGKHTDISIDRQREAVWMIPKTNKTLQTVDNDTFFTVCQRMGIQKHEYRLYFHWLGTDFGPESKITRKSCKQKHGLSFNHPWGGRNGSKSRTLTRFPVNSTFPYPTGTVWDRMRETMRQRNLPDAHKAISISAHLVHTIMRELVEDSGDKRSEMDAFASDVKWPELDLSKYTGEDGRVYAPSTVQEAKNRPDWPRWKDAIDMEVKHITVDYPVIGEPEPEAWFTENGYVNKPTPIGIIFAVK